MRTTFVALAVLTALAASVAPVTAFAPQPLPSSTRALRNAACHSPSTVLQMKNERGDGKVNRRAVLALSIALPLLRGKDAVAMTEAEELVKLQAEAARIQEIFDVQKEANSNLPSLKDNLMAAKNSAPAPGGDEPAVATVSGSSVDSTDVQKVVDSLMTSLKRDGDKGMEVVLANSAPGNPMKDMGYKKVCDYMRETKLAVILGQFSNYRILKPQDIGNDNENHPRVQVDVLVKAPYSTMLQNGMQFSDMAMGDESDKLCTATLRWKMRQEPDGKWENLGCVIVDPINPKTAV